MMVKTGVLLILVGLLFKVSAAPFHFWAPDVYEGAPTLVTMFMATVVKTAAFAAFYRLFSTCFVSLADTWVPVVAVLSAITMLLGNIMAVFQSSFKRMLAYSSIAHAGYMMMAIAAMNEVSAGSIFLYALAYSIGSLGAFACLHAMSSHGDESISGLNGLGNRQPKVAIFLSLIMFSLAGIPPVAGFFAKYYLFYGALMGGYTWLVLTAVLSSLIGVYYYFRVIFALFKTSPVADEELPKLLPTHYVLLVLSAIISLGIGLSPAWLQSLIS
ncbi:MAG: NADH-quinone oxidoreductase subunit N [Bacteroidetes bacterium]|nr:NADH-quinone oxidoreductase subunit N [Bacteroidota bacterium]